MTNLNNYEEIIIWGASFPPCEFGENATSLGYSTDRLLNLLKANGYMEKVVCFVDNNQMFQGRMRSGIAVKSPEELLKYPKALVIINSISVIAISKQMKEMSLPNKYMVVPVYYYGGTQDVIYDVQQAKMHMEEHKNDILSLYDMSDPITHAVIKTLMYLRLKAEDDLYSSSFYEGLEELTGYFLYDDLAPKGDVSFYDIGAFCGETIEPVIKFYGDRLKKVYAFEPNQLSRNAMVSNLNRYNMGAKLKIYPWAVGSSDRTVKFASGGNSSCISEDGELELELKAFDNMSDIAPAGDAMIKMDIEGAEMDALRGMEDFIKKYQPYLAICIYHKVEDILDIPEYIKSLNPSYRCLIRGGLHLECYAVPERHYKNLQINFKADCKI